MSPIEIDYLGEGPTDAAAARVIIRAAGCVPGINYVAAAPRGKPSVDRRLPGLNKGLAHSERRLLVLRDLDVDANCAAELVARLEPAPHGLLCLRVAVRALEAWLMADAAAYARHCRIKPTRLPNEPDALADPKRFLLELAEGKASALTRFARERRRAGLADWQLIAGWNLEFIETAWDPLRAQEGGRSPSLNRALAAVRRLAAG